MFAGRLTQTVGHQRPAPGRRVPVLFLRFFVKASRMASSPISFQNCRATSNTPQSPSAQRRRPLVCGPCFFFLTLQQVCSKASACGANKSLRPRLQITRVARTAVIPIRFDEPDVFVDSSIGALDFGWCEGTWCAPITTGSLRQDRRYKSRENVRHVQLQPVPPMTEIAISKLDIDSKRLIKVFRRSTLTNSANMG